MLNEVKNITLTGRLIFGPKRAHKETLSSFNVFKDNPTLFFLAAG